MSKKRVGMNFGIRYSEAFKMEVIRELEENDLPFAQIQQKYGIKGCATVQSWARKYGNGTRGKVIRVQKPEEIDEQKRLKLRVRRLETALADANVDLAIERGYTRLACDRAGIKDVEAFKKKPMALRARSCETERKAFRSQRQLGVPEAEDHASELLPSAPGASTAEGG